MRLPKLALGTTAALGALMLTGAAAAAAIQNSHVLTVQLPDGAVAHIRYFGDTPPEVRLDRAAPFAPAAWPGSTIGLFDPSFPAFEQAMAQMDDEADLMLAQAQKLMNAPPNGEGLTQANFGALPPGASGYSFVSTVSGRGVCTRTVEYRSTGGGRPQVIRKSSGDCGDAGEAPSKASTVGAEPGARLTSAAYHPAT